MAYIADAPCAVDFKSEPVRKRGECGSVLTPCPGHPGQDRNANEYDNSNQHVGGAYFGD